MYNKLLILLLIGIIVYTYVNCYSQSTSESFGNPITDANIIRYEARGSWGKSCYNPSWEPDKHKLTATCRVKRSRGMVKTKTTSAVCPKHKFKNKKGVLKCE